MTPRSAMRRSWAQVPLVTLGHVQVVFVVGQTSEGHSDVQESTVVIADITKEISNHLILGSASG